MTKEYRMKGGHILADEDFERLGEMEERGELPPGEWGEWIVRPPGRPQLHPTEELVTIAFKVPKSHRALLDIKAKEAHSTRSQFMRDILDEALTA